MPLLEELAYSQPSMTDSLGPMPTPRATDIEDLPEASPPSIPRSSPKMNISSYYTSSNKSLRRQSSSETVIHHRRTPGTWSSAEYHDADALTQSLIQKQLLFLGATVSQGFRYKRAISVLEQAQNHESSATGCNMFALACGLSGRMPNSKDLKPIRKQHKSEDTISAPENSVDSDDSGRQDRNDLKHITEEKEKMDSEDWLLLMASKLSAASMGRFLDHVQATSSTMESAIHLVKTNAFA
ncbi:hypothetical protein BDZ45DRAFT_755676 [Acephala macrosclerotiorum]|nr:hypothetical protein BDZ45DRAFT_755676 [Acephala macrosclerotiorum]